MYRESWDAEKVKYDPTHRPLLDWDAKVAAALTACRQTNAITKDGSVVGPVAPFVNRTLGRDRQASSSASQSGARPSAAPRGAPLPTKSSRGRGSGGKVGSRGGAVKPKPRATPARQQDAGARGADGVAGPL